MYYDCALALLVTCAFVVSLNCRAIKNGKGLHSKKEVPIHRVADISGVGISFFFFFCMVILYTRVLGQTSLKMH